MSYSDESVFWNEREEDGYGGVFASESFQSNHPFQNSNQSFYNDDLASKMIVLSPDSECQEVDEESSPRSRGPLGLKLTKTPSFMNLLQEIMNKARQAQLQPTRNMEDSRPRTNPERLKAANLPAFYIRIGSWERVTRHEGDVTAKMYYAKRKMVWEVLEGALKSKMEIQWADIIGIRAITPKDEMATLEVELGQPPLFYREINPQPRKHTLWQQASDFTGGQAPIWRRHYLKFAPGVLDKHYEKLLQCDKRLLKLTENPFPVHECPFFDPTMFGIPQISSLFYNGYGSSNYQNPYNSRPRAPSLTQHPSPTMPAMGYSFSNSNRFMAPPTASYRPNMGVLGGLDQQFLQQSNMVSSNMAMSSLLDPITATTTTAYPYIPTSTDQVMPTYDPTMVEDLFSQHLNFLPPQESHHETLAMPVPLENYQINDTSLPPFYFQTDNPPTGGFF